MTRPPPSARATPPGRGRGRLRASLRLRLIAGASAIALIAMFAALVTAYGAEETARRIEGAAAAQRRMDQLSSLSARVSDYAVIAVESEHDGSPQPLRLSRLESRAGLVSEAFRRVDRALAAAVEREPGEAEKMRLATRSLIVARMDAQFAALRRAVEPERPARNLRAVLDGFATRFSPLLNEAISDERRDRDAAAAQIRDLHDRGRTLTLVASLAAPLLAAIYYLFLIRPLLAQLRLVRDAAERIGGGAFDVALPERRDEIGRLFAAINRMADRLKARREAVDADRAALNETIASRTAALSEANERLSRIDAERRRFFADVGHELRTPLTVILAESELGLQEGVGAPEAMAALRVIRARAARLNRRIDDLLRVARSETGRIELDSRPFDLSAAAEAAAADMAPLAKRRGLTLTTRLAPAPAVGDADWCRQVLSGLIDNAIRHAPQGGAIEIAAGTGAGPGEASRGAEADAAQVWAAVIDEGEGLPAEEAETVFERFARGSREQSGSGFGVGLALARWVLERQGGSVRLLSPAPRPPEGGSGRGPGALAALSLPAQEGTRAAAPRREAAKQESAGSGA